MSFKIILLVQSRFSDLINSSQMRDLIFVIIIQLFIMTNPRYCWWWVSFNSADQLNFKVNGLGDFGTTGFDLWGELDFQENHFNVFTANSILSYTIIVSTVFFVNVVDLQNVATKMRNVNLENKIAPKYVRTYM